MSPTKDGSAATSTTFWANGAAAASESALARQFISEPMDAGIAFATTDTIKSQVRCQESAVNDNINRQPICVKVYSEDGTTLQATLKALGHIGPNTTEWLNTGLRNKTVADSDTLDANYTTVAGDRLVIEVGGQVSTAGGTSVTGTMSFGSDNGSDLGENETDTTALNPWFEISRTVTFPSPPTPLAGMLRSSSRILSAVLLSTVALSGTIRATPARFTSQLSAPIIAPLAGTLRATPARLQTTGMVLVYHSTPIRGAERITGATLDTRVALAGTLRATTARLQSAELSIVSHAAPIRAMARLPGATLSMAAPGAALTGTLRAGPGRLSAQLTTTVALSSILRASPARLQASLGLALPLAGTLRSSTARLTGDLRSSVALAGTLRTGSGRLSGKLDSTVALTTTLRSSARLTGDLGVIGAGVVSLTSRLRATSARLSGQLVMTTALTSTMRGTGARLLGTIHTRAPLASTLRVTNARLSGALLTTVALSSYLRATSGRLTAASFTQSLPLTSQLRVTSARLRGQLVAPVFGVAVLQSVLRGTSARLTGQLGEMPSVVLVKADTATFTVRNRLATLTTGRRDAELETT